MEGFSSYIVLIGIFAALFFVIAAFALHWAVKRGHMRDLDRQATSVFDSEEEPEGVQTDYFPSKKKKRPTVHYPHDERA